MSRTAFVLLLLVLAAGCGEEGIQTPTGNEITIGDPGVDPPIRTIGDRFVLRPGPVYSSVEIPFVYENRTDSDYYLAHCNGAYDFRLEKRIGDAWVEFHGPILPACLSVPPIRIAPGERWTSAVAIYVSIQDGISPEPIALDPVGTYRIVLFTLRGFDLGVFPFGPSVPKSERVSNAFELAVEAPASRTVIGGIEYSATTRITRVGPTFPASLTSWITARNLTGERATLRVPAECQVTLKAYVGPAASGRPVWDAARLARCAPSTFIELDILPGDSLELYFETNEEEIRGDSLSPGTYAFSLAIDTGDGGTLEVPTTTADLGALPLRDVEVRLGEQVQVPGTDLRIRFMEVVRDERCTGFGPDGQPIVCIWEGFAELGLELSTPDLGVARVTTGPGFAPLIAYGRYTLQFWGLSPGIIPEDPREYVVTLRVSG